MSPRLRPMTSADLDHVLELELALFGEEAWSRQMLAGELDSSRLAGTTSWPRRRARLSATRACWLQAARRTC